MTVNNFERRTTYIAGLLNDLIIALCGILILLFSISGIWLWSMNQPFSNLPEWLFSSPAAFSDEKGTER